MSKRKRKYIPTGRKPGRPKGSKNKPKPAIAIDQVVYVIPGRCNRCGSTGRTPYKGHRRVMKRKGTAPDGKPYNRKTWRDTKCLNPKCRQSRVDIVLEYIPEEKNTSVV